MKPVSRVPYSISQCPDGRGRIMCMLGGMLGKEFVYDPSSQESKDAALRAFDEYAIETTSQIEATIGRRLTDQELRCGMAHAEDEEDVTRAKIRQERAAMFAPPDTTDPNPFNRLLAEHKAAKKRDRDPKAAWLEEAAEKWDAKQTAAEEKAKRDADPRRQRCIEDATATKLAAIFDPTLPASEVRAADHRLRIAREGDPKLYKQEVNQFRQRHVERLQQLAQPHLDGLARHRAAIRQLQHPFELPSVTTDYESGKAIDVAAEGERLGIDTAGMIL